MKHGNSHHNFSYVLSHSWVYKKSLEIHIYFRSLFRVYFKMFAQIIFVLLSEGKIKTTKPPKEMLICVYYFSQIATMADNRFPVIYSLSFVLISP